MIVRTRSAASPCVSTTASMNAGSALRIARARSSLTQRGLVGVITMPIASAPSSHASSASSTRVTPQIFTRIRDMREDPKSTSSAKDAKYAKEAKHWILLAYLAYFACFAERCSAFLQRYIGRRLPFWRITRPEEGQALRHRGDAGDAAVARGQQFGNPPDRPLAPPDFQQRTHDVAHHVVQESVGFDLHGDALTLAPYAHRADMAKRMAGLARYRTERGKILLAQERLRRRVHRVGIQRHALPRDEARLERGTDRTIEDHIAVAPRPRRKAGMKVARHRPRPQHGDRVGQARGRAQHPRAFLAFC